MRSIHDDTKTNTEKTISGRNEDVDLDGTFWERSEQEDNEIRKNKKLRQEQRRRQVQRMRLVCAAAVVAVLITGILLFIRFAPSRKRMQPAEYFAQQMIEAGAQGDVIDGENDLAVVLHDHVAAEKAILFNNELYLNYDMVRKQINSRFFWDEGNAMVIFTTPLETYEISPDSKTYVIDDTAQTYEREILKTVDGVLYLDAKFMQQFTNVEATIYPEEKHVVLEYMWGSLLAADVTKSSAVRMLGGIKSVILTDVQADDTVYILEQMDSWSRVATKNGYIGYIQNKRLKNVGEREFSRAFDAPEYTSLCMDEKVNLVWNQIDLREMNSFFEGDTANMTGVNVISPTWFALTDNEGAYTSFADESYVKAAHAKGLQVWGLISNFSPDMSTTVLLSSTAARRRLARNLVGDAITYGLDGINLDLEAISEEAGSAFVQFVREISILCRKHGLVLSVDVPVPMSFNRYYNRQELGTVADYVIIMGYDEHYYGSEAGSVGSLPFEEAGILGTLENVPARKIISGVPFYTRLWYTRDAGDGSIETWSEIIGMNNASNTMESYGVTPVWDEELGQNYAVWELEDGITCQIWVEDEESIAQKAALVKKYDLGGIAAWVLGNQRDTIWEVITQNIA